MLPEPLKYLAGFASLNVEWLAPHDTITTTIQTASGIHGTFSITFALPAKSIGGQSYKITGSKGQLITSSEDGKLKVTITDTKGHVESNLYDVDGVPIELANFLKVVKGGEDNGLGDPYNTLKDVALIQAAIIHVARHGAQFFLLDSLPLGFATGPARPLPWLAQQRRNCPGLYSICTRKLRSYSCCVLPLTYST